MHKKPVEILVFGTGAVGATFAWRVAQNPHVRVTAVCRSNFNAVKKNGFVMKSQMWGDGVFRPHRVIQRVNEVRDIPFDYVVCANKIVESPGSSFIEDLRPAISEHTTLVSAQNGFCVEAPLHRSFPKNTILSAVCYVSCTQNTPGQVRQVAAIRPNAFHIGMYHCEDQELGNDKLNELVNLSSRFGRTEDITSERWTKLIFNGSWNPTAAIYGLTTQEVYQHDQALTHCQNLANEIYSVARAAGVDIPVQTPVDTTNCARSQPPITLSMLQDVQFGRQMEIEALCGSILRQALSLGVSVPTIQATYETLMMINRRMAASIPFVDEPIREHDFIQQYTGNAWSLAATA